MDNKNTDNSPSSLWNRRSNSSQKLNLSTSKTDRSDSRDTYDAPFARRHNPLSSQGKSNPFSAIGSINTSAVASPTGTGASSAFGLGSGAFASFGSAGKTPKTPGASFDLTKASADKKDSSEEDKPTNRRPPPPPKSSSYRVAAGATASAESPAPASKPPTPWPLKDTWIIYYRPPTNKNSDYEKSIKPLCKIPTAQAFWSVYVHLRHPSQLPTVSDYHIFKDGIRPVWEDEENKKGGKWTMRLKKGVADRYWEDLLLALVGDQFAEASEEVCGAVVSVRSGEDVFSIWTKNDGGRNIKIRETIKRVLSLPTDTNLQWRSHDESIVQRNAADQARQDKANQQGRRNTLVEKKDEDETKS